MHDATMLNLRCAAGSTGARSGQAIVIFAISIAVLIGMIGLAVDVGHAYERRQFLQGAAHNAALAGAFELNSTDVARTNNLDAAIVQRMVDTLRKSGLTVSPSVYNSGTNTLTQLTNWTACQASPPLSTTQVYLQAVYTTGDPPVPIPGDYVGQGAGNKLTQGETGVEVTRLAMCVPRFFTGAVWHGNYDVGVSAVVGQSETAPPSLGAIAPFYVFGEEIKLATNPTTYLPSLYGVDAPSLTKNPNGQAPWEVKCVAKGNKSAPWSVPMPSCTNTPGDLVTVTDQAPAGGSGSNNWEGVQFFDAPSGGSSTFPNNYTPDGLDYHPTAFATNDQSVRGCLLPSVNNVTVGSWYYNHGGEGHCAPTPTVGDTVAAAIVDQVCKNQISGNCQDGTTIATPCSPQTGGYCVHVVGTALVYIVTATGSATKSKGKLVQGYIVGVYQDPDCIVQLSGYHPACTYNY